MRRVGAEPVGFLMASAPLSTGSRLVQAAHPETATEDHHDNPRNEAGNRDPRWLSSVGSGPYAVKHSLY